MQGCTNIENHYAADKMARSSRRRHCDSAPVHNSIQNVRAVCCVKRTGIHLTQTSDQAHRIATTGPSCLGAVAGPASTFSKLPEHLRQDGTRFVGIQIEIVPDRRRIPPTRGAHYGITSVSIENKSRPPIGARVTGATNSVLRSIGSADSVTISFAASPASPVMVSLRWCSESSVR